MALVYPYPTNVNSWGELWQAVSGYRFVMTGGYFVVPAASGVGSANVTTDLTERTLRALRSGPAPVRTPVLRRELRAQLASWHVRSVVVLPVGYRPVRFFAWLLGRPPTGAGGGVVWWSHIGSGPP